MIVTARIEGIRKAKNIYVKDDFEILNNENLGMTRMLMVLSSQGVPFEKSDQERLYLKRVVGIWDILTFVIHKELSLFTLS